MIENVKTAKGTGAKASKHQRFSKFLFSSVVAIAVFLTALAPSKAQSQQTDRQVTYMSASEELELIQIMLRYIPRWWDMDICRVTTTNSSGGSNV